MVCVVVGRDVRKKKGKKLVKTGVCLKEVGEVAGVEGFSIVWEEIIHKAYAESVA